MATAAACRHPGECCDSVVDDFVVIGRAGLLVRDIQVVTAGQPDPQHDACHASSLRAATRR